MSLTVGNLITRVQGVLGNSSTAFTNYLLDSFNLELDDVFNSHDWTFKHKTGTFNTVAGTEGYNLATSTTDIRSANDVEIMYDVTNGRELFKTDLQEIRRLYPKEDTSGQPRHYAVWGNTNIILADEPDGIFAVKYLYTANPVLATTTNDNVQTTILLPIYMNKLIYEKMLASGMEYYDDSRRAAKLEEIQKLHLRQAIEADNRYLTSCARFKFWEEVKSSGSNTYDDFLRYSFWGPNR